MSDQDQTAIARQLEALGEDPPSDAESFADVRLDDDADVASVAALIGLSQPLEGVDAGRLTDMERARAWRKVEARLGAGAGHATPSPQRRGGASGRPWALIATGLAAAAVVTFVLVRPGAGPEGSADADGQHEMALAMGEQARAGLQTLGVEPGGETRRARDMLEDYEARLSSQAGGAAG